MSISGTTVGLEDLVDPACAYGTAPEALFSFTAPAAGTYTFDTVGSPTTMAVEVRDGSCSGPALGCSYSSSVSASLAAQQTVVVVVQAYSAGSGSYVLHVK